MAARGAIISFFISLPILVAACILAGWTPRMPQLPELHFPHMPANISHRLMNLFSKSKVIPTLNKTYDYIIVGGGTAGCVLASRLSEDPSLHILLLEAGKEETDYWNMEMPAAASSYQRTETDWAYETIPQTDAAKALYEQISYWPAGKVLGGGSSINYMNYLRGSPHDYDKWEAMGADGWGFQNVLPYFLKSENNTNEALVNSGFHGSDGPIGVSIGKATGIRRNVINALTELGFQEGDMNGVLQQGFSKLQVTMRDGRRTSTASNYLRPAIDRRNLQVVTEATVTKILFLNKRAVGVELMLGGEKKFVGTRREVILSAGVIGSPKLLMLSGIGPKYHLEQLKIQEVVDLPVGTNLQDHIYTNAVQVEIEEPISLFLNKMQQIGSLIQYKLFKTGFMQYSMVETITLTRASRQPPGDKYPYLTLKQTGHLLSPSFRHQHNVKKEVWDALYADLTHGFELIPHLLHSRSRGTVRLRSQDPQDPPLIDPKYLSDPNDARILLDGIKMGRRIVKTRALKRLGAKLSENVHPLCKQHKPFSDPYWICFIKHNTFTAHNYVGTCKMGRANDTSAVVDPQLRVRGVTSLRVVDASVMPQVISGNTNAAVIMIAEKAADMIRRINTVNNIKLPEFS